MFEILTTYSYFDYNTQLYCDLIPAFPRHSNRIRNFDGPVHHYPARRTTSCFNCLSGPIDCLRYPAALDCGSHTRTTGHYNHTRSNHADVNLGCPDIYGRLNIESDRDRPSYAASGNGLYHALASDRVYHYHS